jgi:hypothetical protein
VLQLQTKSKHTGQALKTAEIITEIGSWWHHYFEPNRNDKVAVEVWMKTRPEQLKRILEYKLRQKYRISSGTKSGFRNKSAVQ